MGKVYRFSFVFLLIGLFLVEFFHPITAINVDLGRHLLLGEIITKMHQVPKTNLLAYTYIDFPYINTSWLSDVIYYYLFVFGGFSLLLFVNTFLIAFAFGLVVWYATQKYPLTLASLFSVTLYLLLLSLRPDIRPEVMSMVCMSLFMVILFSSRGDNKKNLLYLVPIEVAWVNLHIYFFIGPLLIVLFLLANLITDRFQFSKAKIYLLALGGTLAAMLLNPNGIKGALFPLMVFNNYGFPVAENQSIPTLFSLYHASNILLSAFAIFLLFTILFLARRNTKLIDWLLAIVFSMATIFIFRNILLFVFATFISFTMQLNFLAAKYRPFVKKLPPLSYFLIYPLSLLLIMLFILASINKNGFGFGVTAYGESATDFIIAHHMSGLLYNNFDIGDYLSYRIYPQLVFVENRPEAYPTSFFQKIYIPMQNNPMIFQKLDQRYHFNALVLSHWDNTPWGYRLFGYLVNNSSFKLVYLDSYTIILLRSTPANNALITQYLVTKKSFKITSAAPQELVHYLFFFEKVGWTEQVTTTLSQMRKNDPKLCALAQYPIEKTSLSAYVTKHKLNRNCSSLDI